MVGATKTYEVRKRNMISTTPFRMQPKEFLQVTVRDNYRRFWWLPLICLACAIVIWVDGGIVNLMIGAAFLLIGLLEPLLLSKWKVALTMRSPMSTKDFSVEGNASGPKESLHGKQWRHKGLQARHRKCR